MTIAWSDSTDTVWDGTNATVAKVGGGIINAKTVVEATTSVDTAKFALNDTANFKPTHSVTITNKARSSVLYTFTHEAAAAFGLYSNSSNGGSGFVNELVTPFTTVEAQVKVPEPIRIGPNSRETITLTFSLPDLGTVSPLDFPIYSGKIWIKGSNGDSLSIPYLGTWLHTPVIPQMSSVALPQTDIDILIQKVLRPV